MIPSLRTGAAALLACLGLATIPIACQSGGIGDPCTPDEESDPQFAGFGMDLAFVESRSFQCATRICLVNHFQGRVSCPLGQTAESIKDCGGPGGAHDELCDTDKGESCVVSSTLTVDCDPADPGTCGSFGAVCDPGRRVCVCGANTTPPDGFHCSAEGDVQMPKRFVCHKPGACQSADADAASNAGKACCAPGTDTPVASPVCGQCSHASKRDTEQAVYCSCRCGVADGQPPEPDFNFCSCPNGYSCTEIRPELGLGDRELNGKYCIRDGTAYGGNPVVCGAVAGNHEMPCNGTGGG